MNPRGFLYCSQSSAFSESFQEISFFFFVGAVEKAGSSGSVAGSGGDNVDALFGLLESEVRSPFPLHGGRDDHSPHPILFAA